MKAVIGRFLGLSLILQLLSLAPVFASDQDPPVKSNTRLLSLDWAAVEDLLARCAEIPYSLSEDGQTVLRESRSICPAELSFSGTSPKAQVSFSIGGQLYVAYTLPSPGSDGNDLMDLSVYLFLGLFNYQLVAKETAIPSFGDPLQTLALGRDDIIPLVFDSK
jgi:hypothetical protein